MSAFPHMQGDLGEYILELLGERGVHFPQTNYTARLTSKWHMYNWEERSNSKNVILGVQDCSLEDISRYLFMLISPFRLWRPYACAIDSDNSFQFSINDKEGQFIRIKSGLMVRFIALGFYISVAQSGEELSVAIIGDSG